MKKDMIAVCDSEAGYAGNFADYLNARKKFPFRAEAFTDSEKLCQYAEKNCPRFLLIAEENLTDQVQKLQIPHMIILSSEKESEAGEDRYVYKYQSAESLVREVMTYCQESPPTELELGYKKKLGMAGIYSPLGRCGKTLFALTVGQILGEQKNTLYINMEDFSGWQKSIHEADCENLSDFFYCLRTGREKPALDTLIQSWGNLDYFSPVSSFEDLRGISFQEWTALFEFLEKESSYQQLVLDIGNGADQLFSMLELCDKIYMPVLEDWISQYKIQQFKNMAEVLSDSLLEKITELHLSFAPCAEKNPDFPKSLLHGKWGAEVRRILEVKGPLG